MAAATIGSVDVHLDATAVAQVTGRRRSRQAVATATDRSRPIAQPCPERAHPEGPVDIENVTASRRPPHLTDWRSQARCRGVGPSLFYGGRGEAITAMAVDVCRQCPVRGACLDDAIATEVDSETFGIRGGKSPDQRRMIRRRRRMANKRRVAV